MLNLKRRNFKGKLETLKESYFPKVKKETTENIDNVETEVSSAQDIDLTDSMVELCNWNCCQGFDKGKYINSRIGENINVSNRKSTREVVASPCTS